MTTSREADAHTLLSLRGAGVSTNGRHVESFPAGLEKAKEEAADACLAVQDEDAPASVLQKCIDLSVEAAALSDRTITSEQSF